MIGKCRAIAHGSNALEYIFRDGKLGKTLIRQNEMYRFGKTKCDYFV